MYKNSKVTFIVFILMRCSLQLLGHVYDLGGQDRNLDLRGSRVSTRTRRGRWVIGRRGMHDRFEPGRKGLVGVVASKCLNGTLNIHPHSVLVVAVSKLHDSSDGFQGVVVFFLVQTCFLCLLLWIGYAAVTRLDRS